MLCYRCGSHVPDSSESCGTCGQKLSGGGVRQATATFSRRRHGSAAIDGSPFKPGDKVAERYEIKDVVGVGPLGYVFRAQDTQLDVEVALKVINQRLIQTAEERKHFAKAIRLGRKLSHPNLLRVFDDGEDHDRPFYTMQFVEGLTLRKIIDLRLSKGQFFNVREVEPILGQIAAALDSAHKQGVHSNLKPENVLVLPDLLKVSDFGLALAMPRPPFVQAQKQKRADRYISPEYVQGLEIDVRADVYAMAVVVGEMLSGLAPDGAIPELAERNPDVPMPIEGLYRRALSPNPLARPATAGAFFDEFTEIVRKVTPPPIRQKPEAASPARASRTSAPALEGIPRAKEISKPPPPVPDELRDDAEFELDNSGDVAEEVTSSSIEDIPIDATQPLDSMNLPPLAPPHPVAPVAARRAKSDHDDATEIMDSMAIPAALAAAAAASAANAAASAAAAAPPPPPPMSAPHPLFASVRPDHAGTDRRKSKAAIWLGVLMVSGLALGAGAGYWALSWMRQPAAHDPSTPVPVPLAEAPAHPAVPPPVPRPDKPPEPVVPPAPPVDPAAAARAQAEQHAAEVRAAAIKAAEDKRQAELRAVQRKEERRAETKLAAAARVPAASGCADGMRMVPAGVFKLGTAADDPMRGFDEFSFKNVELPAFCIDQYEYPNRKGTTPTVNVSWNDAKKFCEGKGKRLCSEEEWEKACKGPGNARFPYGTNFDATACNTEDETGEDRALSTSGKYGKCRSGYGVADMSGNVAEWTSSPYSTNQDKTQKGGAYDRPDYASRCSARKNGSPGSRSSTVGFRCCVESGG